MTSRMRSGHAVLVLNLLLLLLWLQSLFRLDDDDWYSYVVRFYQRTCAYIENSQMLHACTYVWVWRWHNKSKNFLLWLLEEGEGDMGRKVHVKGISFSLSPRTYYVQIQCIEMPSVISIVVVAGNTWAEVNPYLSVECLCTSTRTRSAHFLFRLNIPWKRGRKGENSWVVLERRDITTTLE